MKKYLQISALVSETKDAGYIDVLHEPRGTVEKHCNYPTLFVWLYVNIDPRNK